jgi:uncharacterized protein YraI
MKRFLSVMAVCFCCAAVSAQSMKMVVDNKGNVEGRFVSENDTAFIVDVQDTYPIPKKGLRVVTFRAEKGQGVVYRNQERKGNINVRKGPSLKYAVVAKIPEFDGVPDCYPCLGKVNGWYKIRIQGKIGYVREDMACWDGMNTF